MPRLNRYLNEVVPYASKSISQAAKADPAILDLSIGEPAYGPPGHLLHDILSADLGQASFLDGARRYEQSRGCPHLRQDIAMWYAARYGLHVDPEREILVTHGAVEGLAVALLAVTEASDEVDVPDPAYLLYDRLISTLGRRPRRWLRLPGEHEYAERFALDPSLAMGRAWLVNSPENPTGYMLSRDDWAALARAAERADAWIIHDEVYDTLAFDRPHLPARGIPGIAARSILVNSCSKKFGLPGLRIGWLIAEGGVVDVAAKAHDYLCLGVNILAERVASRLLRDPTGAAWLEAVRVRLAARRHDAMHRLDHRAGFAWPRQPRGGMFLFPEVSAVHERLPAAWRPEGREVGAAVAQYLLRAHKIAAVPGGAYGASGATHLRLTTGGAHHVFEEALDRLASMAA